MKKVTLLSIIILGFISLYSQISLEHTYNRPFVNGSYTNEYFWKVAKFSSIDEKYVFTDSAKVTLYNLNHSLYKTINLPYLTTVSPPASPELYNISDKLFDTDGDLEVMVTYYVLDQSFNTLNQIINIFNEDGSVVLNIDSASPYRRDYDNSGIFTFYNTSEGAKMVVNKLGKHPIDQYLSHKGVSVYSLPGTYISGIKQNPEDNYYSGMLSNPSPNPSSTKTHIQYQLPDGVSSGIIIVFTTDGREQKRYNVDRNFNDLVLDNTDLPSGNYLYSLVTQTGYNTTKKMMVIR